MSLHPWLAGQMASDRIHDLERAAREHGPRPEGTTVPAPTGVATEAGRRVLARHMGSLLIALGRKLAGPEGLPAAFDAHR
ncbi:MAG: hypothetical protein ACRDY1_10250 [Acidimicrobiales bacterium]